MNTFDRLKAWLIPDRNDPELVRIGHKYDAFKERVSKMELTE